jgi:ribonuclease Z
MELTAYSKGLYSSWVFDYQDRTLFDCGEGCASYLGNQVYAIERICLGHGHTDHISGLPTLINVRNSGFGDKTKPLDIYYAEGDKHVESMLDYLRSNQPNLKYALTTHTLRPGDKIPLSDRKHIQAFQTIHHSGLSLGYLVAEDRRRLSPAFAHLSQKQIQEGIRLKTLDPKKLSENYTHPIFGYALDSYKFDTKAVKGVETLMVDTTFLNDEDKINLNEDGTPGQLRKTFSHATLEEGFLLAKEANVQKRLILGHFSPRYNHREIETAVMAMVRKHDPKFQVVALSDQRKPYVLPYSIEPQKDAPSR